MNKYFLTAILLGVFAMSLGVVNAQVVQNFGGTDVTFTPNPLQFIVFGGDSTAEESTIDVSPVDAFDFQISDITVDFTDPAVTGTEEDFIRFGDTDSTLTDITTFLALGTGGFSFWDSGTGTGTGFFVKLMGIPPAATDFTGVITYTVTLDV